MYLCICQQRLLFVPPHCPHFYPSDRETYLCIPAIVILDEMNVLWLYIHDRRVPWKVGRVRPMNPTWQVYPGPATGGHSYQFGLKRKPLEHPREARYA